MDKILVIASPVARYHQICVYKDSQLIDNFKASLDDLIDIIFAAVEKYDIHTAVLSGPFDYVKGIGEVIMENSKDAIANYSTMKQQLEIEYL